MHRLQFQSINSNTAINSLQTSTGTRIRLHVIAIIVEHQTEPGNTLRYARLKTLHVVGVERRGTLIHYAEAPGHPYTLEAQDYSHSQSQESPQDYNQSLETAQYSTPYFMSKEELPQMKCNSLKTVQVSRLGANEQSEHIRPAWIAQSQNSKKHQVAVEIDTGAGCNVMPLYKVQELFG